MIEVSDATQPNSIPLVNFYEAQAAFAADLISMLGTKGRTRARVRTSAMAIYNEWLQSRLQRTVRATTNSYFTAGTGRIVSQWPSGPTAYVLATKLLRRPAVRVS